MSNDQKVSQRDIDYAKDTINLIEDIISSNKIPNDIAFAALTRVLLTNVIKGTSGPLDFAVRVKSLCDLLALEAAYIIKRYKELKEKGEL